jgi:hypothetical protein
VGRQYADDRDACELERKRSRATDDLSIVEHGVETLDGKEASEALGRG